MYCPKCGKELPEGVEFCPNCGTAVEAEAPLGKTAFERIGQDSGLQQHWIRRIVAIVVDSILVGLVTTVLAVIVFFPWFLVNPFGFFNWLSFPFLMGLIYVGYFMVAESGYGRTIGKGLVGLQVVTVDRERLSLERAFIRNISKIFWVLLILDVVGGFFTVGDPRQKYSDRIAGTTVV